MSLIQFSLVYRNSTITFLSYFDMTTWDPFKEVEQLFQSLKTLIDASPPPRALDANPNGRILLTGATGTDTSGTVHSSFL